MFAALMGSRNRMCWKEPRTREEAPRPEDTPLGTVATGNVVNTLHFISLYSLQGCPSPWGLCWCHKSCFLASCPWWLRRLKVCLQCQRPEFDPWVRKIPWRRKWQPTPVFLPGKSHGWRSLVGYSPWGYYESDTTERLHFHFQVGHLSFQGISVF